MARRTSNVISITRNLLITSSILYIVIAALGTGIAVIENRLANPGGFSTGLPPLQDFLYGSGTALSPLLYLLIAQGVFTVLAAQYDRWQAVGVGGLTITGLLYGIGMLVEPILFEIFQPARFDLLKAVIAVGLIIVPFMMMILGMREWMRSHLGK